MNKYCRKYYKGKKSWKEGKYKREIKDLRESDRYGR